MIRFLLDENFNGEIVDRLRSQNPDIDMVRAQDIELYGAADPVVLEWAACEKRVLLTHDVRTMTKFANDRLAQGLPLAGVIFVPRTVSISKAVEDLLTVWGASEASDWENKTDFLPL